MKKETTTVTTVTKIVYVSDDNKEFDTSSECLSHEQKLHHAEELFKKMPYFRLTPEFIPNDVALSWYYVSDDDDISAIELADGVENIRSQLNDRQKPISIRAGFAFASTMKGMTLNFFGPLTSTLPSSMNTW